MAAAQYSDRPHPRSNLDHEDTKVRRTRRIFLEQNDRTTMATQTPGRRIRWGVLGAANFALRRMIPALQQSARGEVLALARKCGLDPQEFLAILTGTMFGSRVHRIYGDKIAGQQYAAGGFIFPLALKDIRLVLNEAESAGVPMPSVSVVRDRLITGIARGYSELDWSALGLLAAEEAGLTFEPADAHA